MNNLVIYGLGALVIASCLLLLADTAFAWYRSKDRNWELMILYALVTWIGIALVAHVVSIGVGTVLKLAEIINAL